jgi:actin-related protein
MIGDEAAENRSFLQVTHPMEHGIVKNWEDMKHLWDYTFNEKLKVDTRDKKILLTEPPMNPKANRQKMVEVMFEDYGFGGVYVAIQAVLTLYAQGEPTFLLLTCSGAELTCFRRQVYKPASSWTQVMVSPTSYRSTMASHSHTSPVV